MYFVSAYAFMYECMYICTYLTDTNCVDTNTDHRFALVMLFSVIFFLNNYVCMYVCMIICELGFAIVMVCGRGGAISWKAGTLETFASQHQRDVALCLNTNAHMYVCVCRPPVLLCLSARLLVDCNYRKQSYKRRITAKRKNKT